MKRIDATAHTRGEAEYVDDTPPPSEMLYAAVFSSPVAHGKIRALHTKETSLLYGVLAILTSKDIPGENQIGTIIQDEELLASDEVHYAGQPIALIVATTPEVAQKGVRSLHVDIDALPAITDPKIAFLNGDIIDSPRTFAIGNVDAAWSECDFIVEGQCDIGGQEHVYLETHRSRTIPLEGNLFRIYSSTQSPSAVQRIAARILGLQDHCIEVEVKRLGGAFGGKEEQAIPWACMSTLAAWHTKKPVELVLSRADDITMTGKRHPYKSDFKIGVTKEGKILAYEVKHYQNSGATADLSTAVLERTLFHSTNSYYIPNARIFAACCRTNLPPNTAFRGFGGPQGMFVIECAITKAAERLGLPRGEIQRKNLLNEGDEFPYGQQVKNCNIRASWNTAVEKYQLQKIRERADTYNTQHFETKKGVALMPVSFGISYTATHMNQAGALVHIYTDGSVSVTTGGVEMGQGLSTNITTIAARAFGIGTQRIKIESTNTIRVPNVSPSAASSTTVLNGNAALIAIGKILNRLKTFAAKELHLADKEKITFSNERVLYDEQETDWTWNQLILTAHMNRIDLSAHGFFATPDIFFDKSREKGCPFAYYVYGTAIIEVTVDCLRGTYDIDSVKIVHDLGRPLNELVDRGQVEGGLAQGLGWMTMEDLHFNEKGKLLSNTLASYKVPDVYFMPDEIDITFLENVEEPLGPYGNKAVGEPPLMYGIGVFFAIRDAMRSFKPDKDFHFHSPLTPERVLLQLYSDRTE